MKIRFLSLAVVVFVRSAASARVAEAQLQPQYVINMTFPVPTNGTATVFANTFFNISGNCTWPFGYPAPDAVQTIVKDVSTGLPVYSKTDSLSVPFGNTAASYTMSTKTTCINAGNYVVAINVLRNNVIPNTK